MHHGDWNKSTDFDLHIPLLTQRLRRAIEVLFEGYLYSRDLNRDEWEFAVEFRELDLHKNDWRWLVCKQLVQHRHELRRGDGNADAKMAIGKKSSFVLTELGVQVAAQVFGDGFFESGPNGEATGEPLGQNRAEHLPIFLRDLRELRFRSQLVKRFKLPSPNQERILLAFQEQGWARRIDDPLPPVREQCPKRRLLDTIKSLNRHQKHQVLQFRGDGTGEGICWHSLGG